MGLWHALTCPNLYPITYTLLQDFGVLPPSAQGDRFIVSGATITGPDFGVVPPSAQSERFIVSVATITGPDFGVLPPSAQSDRFIVSVATTLLLLLPLLRTDSKLPRVIAGRIRNINTRTPQRFSRLCFLCGFACQNKEGGRGEGGRRPFPGFK